MGGKAAHAQGRAHEFTKEEARVAGRKGGEVVSANRAHMARIGRMGGRLRGTGSAKPKKLPAPIVPRDLPSGTVPRQLGPRDDEEE